MVLEELSVVFFLLFFFVVVVVVVFFFLKKKKDLFLIFNVKMCNGFGGVVV